MPFQIKDDEPITAQCVIQDFTGILTSTRLIVVTPTEEESYPLEGIAAIGVYEDVKRSNRNQIRERIKRALMGAGCGLVYGALLGPFFISDKPDLSIFLMLAFLTTGIPISQIMPLWETKFEVLNIVFKQSPAKQYHFQDVRINKHLVETFAEKVFAQISNPSKKAFALN